MKLGEYSLMVYGWIHHTFLACKYTNHIMPMSFLLGSKSKITLPISSLLNAISDNYSLV